LKAADHSHLAEKQSLLAAEAVALWVEMGCFKGYKMRNFKKILNILATEKSKVAANDSCCEAADKLNLDNFKNFINSINNKSQEQKRIETRDYLIWTISDVIIKYCDFDD
jgi:hypothetical protein